MSEKNETKSGTVDTNDSFSMPHLFVDETTGADFKIEYIPVTSESLAFHRAREIINKSAKSETTEAANRLLNTIEKLYLRYAKYPQLKRHLQGLRVMKPEDGSILFEWATPSFRVGFSVEPNTDESGWYLVTNPRAGGLGASGPLLLGEEEKIVKWLTEFVDANR
jgi:hypothetical protein